jgi:orotate phosphoribosyltransferase
MEQYKKDLAQTLAETGAIFFDENLILKDGRPTPYFVNMGMFKTGKLSLKIGSFFAGMMMSHGLVEETDIILGPSYKGSAIALGTAIALWQEHGHDVLFDYDRKEEKSHGEATTSKSIFVNRTFFDGCRVFVVDDVATSMTTKYDLVAKVEAQARLMNIEVRLAGIGIGVDREQTAAVRDDGGNVILGRKGENAIQTFVSKTGIPVYTVGGIKVLVGFLYEEGIPVLIRGERRPIDQKTKAEFDEYMEIYGVS